MSMKRMKLEAQPSVPSLYFLLFSRNKVKQYFFCLSPDLSVQYKNIPKIKVLRMPCQFNMIFSGIFEDLLCNNYRRRSCHLATRVVGAPPYRACPPASWVHGGSPPLIPTPTHSIFLPKKSPSISSTSSSSFCCDFRSPCSKLHSQNYFGVCDSSNDSISFCSSALFIANSYCLGDPVLELAC